MNIAENSLHIQVARLAWAVHVSKRPGVEIPSYDYTAGFNVQPRPFVFDLKARSPERARLVEEIWRRGKGRDPLDEVSIL
jgi:hypothetical protein